MVTTNLSRGRPYGLPVEDDTTPLYFRSEELVPFFPPEVIRHMERCSPVVPLDDIANAPPDIRELPKGELPVLVAARLSLSFPVLFCNVPLWTVNIEPGQTNRALQRCGFSDGGICSNFPIHMFDAAVPEWPTFGIALRGSGSTPRMPVWLPEFHGEGIEDSWNAFFEPTQDDQRLLDFLLSIVSSAKDWNDHATTRMPGVRDRVVRVFLSGALGGLNLRLTGEKIMEMARVYGRPAGLALVKRFAPDAAGQPSAGWNEHRWVRYNSFLVALRERISALRGAAEESGYSLPMSDQIADAARRRPLAGNDADGLPLNPAQEMDLASLLEGLEALETAFANASVTQNYTPQPQPSLRIRAPL